MKGICFKEQLFHKVVAGTKTQTRRIIFPKTDYVFWCTPSFEGMATNPDAVLKTDKNGDIICKKDGQEKLYTLKGAYGLFEGDQFELDNSYVRPRYQPDEILFLKEPYAFDEDPPYNVCYAFDTSAIVRSLNLWNNKLFMPERYARYFIQITDVTAQRLQDISYEDAIKEGVESSYEFNSNDGYLHQFKNYQGDDFDCDSIGSYLSLWESINGKGSLSKNPWVWKYDFKLYKK